MEKEQKKDPAVIIVSALMLTLDIVASKVFSLPWYIELIIFLVPYLFCGFEIISEAVENIFKGEVFDESFLMTVATVGAIAIGEYPEAVFVMLFFRVGELFEHIASDRSRRNITSLVELKTVTARIKCGETVKEIPVEDIKAGDTVVVYAGEQIPVDSTVISGCGFVDTSALTGESKPVDVAVGSAILGGCINKDGALILKANAEYTDSAVSKIINLIENSDKNKSKSENFITAFSKIYTPVVVGLAVLMCVVPTLISGELMVWLKRALMFLVVSCPCALVISVPLSYFAGIGNAAHRGILIKGSDSLENLSNADTVIFDKTGTLTTGDFSVCKIITHGISEEELLYIAASAERNSKHPIAEAICEQYTGKFGEVTDVKEISGKGITCRLDGKTIKVGNRKFVEGAFDETNYTTVYVSVDGEYKGAILFEDRIKNNSKNVIEALRQRGIANTVMLTGDKREMGEKVAEALDIDTVKCELLPHEKEAAVRSLTEKSNGKKRKTVYVGDGINDAPSLISADVGIAMGKFGSDIAVESADIVLTDDRIESVVKALDIARKVRRVVVENIVLSLSVKLAVLVLAAVGVATMWESSFADVGVTVIAVLNSMRVLRYKD